MRMSGYHHPSRNLWTDDRCHVLWPFDSGRSCGLQSVARAVIYEGGSTSARRGRPVCAFHAYAASQCGCFVLAWDGQAYDASEPVEKPDWLKKELARNRLDRDRRIIGQ